MSTPSYIGEAMHVVSTTQPDYPVDEVEIEVQLFRPESAAVSRAGIEFLDFLSSYVSAMPIVNSRYFVARAHTWKLTSQDEDSFTGLVTFRGIRRYGVKTPLVTRTVHSRTSGGSR